MQTLVEILARSLVDDPGQVSVAAIDHGDSIVLEVRVAPDDVGKVIGKHGRIVKAIRMLARAAAARDGKRVSVEVL